MSPSRFITPLVALAAALAPTQAFAVTYNVQFCFNYDTAFVDASPGTGDYFTSNGARPARGIAWDIHEHGTPTLVAFGNADWTGATPGCTQAISLDSTKHYDVMGQSEAAVNGNLIDVLSDDATPSLYAYGISNYAPLASTTITVTSPQAPEWNIAAVSGFSLYRRNAGLSGETLTFYTQACPGGTGSCTKTGKAYISLTAGSPNYTKKFLIAHEMGHVVAWLANGHDSADHDPTAPTENCPSTTAGASGHRMVTREYQSQAANEGLANYWAAVAFNDTTDRGCTWTYYKAVDWNGDGNMSDESVTFSCEGGLTAHLVGAPPVVTPYTDADWLGRDYLLEKCEVDHPGGTMDNRATELDWLRFFWDLDSDQGVTTTAIFDVWESADPDTWNATGAGYSDVCGVTDWPAGRLLCAADAEGLLAEWENEFDLNGAAR